MSFLHLFITVALALTVDQRCKEMHARYQKNCHATDILNTYAPKGSLFAHMYSNCQGPYKDVSSATINIMETKSYVNDRGTTVPTLRECAIEANTDKGTALARYNQLGNAFELEVTAEGSVKTTISTVEGAVTCSRGSQDSAYTRCTMKINDKITPIPLKADHELGLVYMNKASLHSLTQSFPTPLAPPASVSP